MKKNQINHKDISILAFCFLICKSIVCYSQTNLSGYVYDAKDSTALVGASVYFDGTSIGVSTRENGFFRIKSKTMNTSGLVIGSLGYEKLVINDYAQYQGDTLKIFLKAEQENIGTVFLETDPWSRKRKMQVFRKEFLGRTKASSKCKIENEEILQLRYSPSKETLIAYADEPLIIVNRHLGYKIKYNLEDFRVEFTKGPSGIRSTYLVYYEGSSFFEELKKRTRRKYIKNRKESYLGSALHFLQALSHKKLDENGFQMFHDGFYVPPYKFFKIEKGLELTKIELLTDKITILYNGFDQSALEASQIFYVDGFGNHTPPNAILFSGKIATNRMAQLVPLDYDPENP